MIWSFGSIDASEALGMRCEFMDACRDGAGALVADPFALAVIFTELVANVVRHAPGPIRISLERDGSKVLLIVQDEGEGIIPAPTLPDPYSENGRGLFIVAALASHLQIAKHASGVGSTIRVVLPLTANVSLTQALTNE